ncbi:MAG: GTP cyclohydrolase I FolE2 [Opitutales bacterium]|nr:GTP cyclohydrolase I FolE2 [Opitutales bacterium]
MNSSPANTTLRPRRYYDSSFEVDMDYRSGIPDLQNQGAAAISGANVPIIQVGISDFRIPLNFRAANGEWQRLEARVSGTVGLREDVKGINMSRIMRVFYEFRKCFFDCDTLAGVLDAYQVRLDSASANLNVRFAYPILKPSLRSGLEGYQYYDAAYEGRIGADGVYRKFVHFDFVYSSACPCSSELAEHARETRDIYAIPHSQRSKARVTVELKPDALLHIEDMQALCEAALLTETQVMVKREDEQAFAEMNGAHVKFVEDAARLVFEQLNADTRIKDFQVILNHLESLHSHDAVAVICKGVPGGFDGSFRDFSSLKC